jgi:hypothetical protein
VTYWWPATTDERALAPTLRGAGDHEDGGPPVGESGPLDGCEGMCDHSYPPTPWCRVLGLSWWQGCLSD